jgi:branched-chain amino acid transport system substrate-binding protein
MIRLRTVTLLSLILALSGCGRDDPIQVGFVAGLTGRVADLGVSGRNGATLAFEQVNAAGGVHGRPVELVVRDDAQDPTAARRVVSELIDRDVEVIIGPMTSSMAMATVALVDAAGVVMVSPTVTTTALSGRDDYFLRVVSTTKDYAAKNARYQYFNRGRRSAGVIYDLNNKAYTETWLTYFREVFESLGGRILVTYPFQSGSGAAFFDAVQTLLAAEPDLVLIVSNAVDAALICQQVRKLDPQVAIAMAEWAATERYIELGGAAAEGAVVAQFLNRNDNAESYRAFHDAYVQRFDQAPGFAGMAGYDAAMVVIEALRSRRSGQGLKEAIIEKGRFSGVQQRIEIDRYGDADRATYITVVRNGHYHTIE